MVDDRVPPWASDETSGEDADQRTEWSPHSQSVPARAIIEESVARVRASSGRARRAKKSHRGLKVTAIVILAVVVIVAGGLAYAWVDLNSKLNSDPISNLLGSSRPPSATATATVKYPGDPFAGRAVNILVLGTDSRDGANASVAGDDPGGMRSDTTFIAHVAADRTRVDVVSIPRDTWITIPTCVDEKNKTISQAGWTKQGFNAAFAYGVGDENNLALGAACSIRAVEAMSNVRIDAYVVVDFSGFVSVVDAIGGVDVTLRCAIYSPNAGGLKLPAGENHLDGMQAVDLARARTGAGLGDGSDLQRIDRQHALFNAIIARVFALNYVTDFPKLYNLVGAVISSITTDLGSNLADIAGFGYSLKNLNMSQVYFTTIPIADAGDGAHVVLVPSLDKPIWDALRSDQPLPGSQPTPTAEPSESLVSPGVSTPSDLPTPDNTTAAASTSAKSSADESTAPPGAPFIQSESDC